MYKMLNKLMGWEYIQWKNSCGSGVARVHVDGAGRVFYWRYKGIKCADVITDPSHVLWLTCSPDKFFPSNVENNHAIET